MRETVLRCKPETRARSARESGWRVRMRLKTKLRFIWRGVLLDALCFPVNVNCDDDEIGILTFQIKRRVSKKLKTACSAIFDFGFHLLDIRGNESLYHLSPGIL